MQILAKIKEEADGDASDVEGPRICIALGRGQSGKLALRWALEKVIPAEALVCFLHVQTPLRSIPNGIGGKYPVENVSPETVKKYKEQLFLEIGKIIKECRLLCDKKKVTSEVYHVESDSVQKGVIEQVYKLGITTLVLGKSSQNVLSRALKKDIPTSIAKHSPKFCTVLVICKGKLYYMKDATQSPTLPSSTRSSNSAATDVSISEVSETSASSADTNQDEMMISRGIQDEAKNRWGGVEDDEATPSDSPLFDFSRGSSPLGLSHNGVKDDEGSTRPSRSPSLDFSQGSSPLGLSRSGNNVENPGPAVKSVLRNQSTPFESRLLEPEATPCHQPWSLLDYDNAGFTPRFGRQASFGAADARSVQESFPDNNGQMHNSSNSTVHPGDVRSMATSVAADQSIYMTMDDSEIILYPNCDAISQMSTDNSTPTNLSLIEGSSVRSPLHLHESVVTGSSMTFTNHEGVLASDFDMLLNEAKRASEWAQTEAQRQASNLRKTEDLIASAKKMLAGHDRQRDEALKDALRDQELLQKRVAEEVRRHQETHTELETLKGMLNKYAKEADLAKQEAETERKRCEEALLKLQEVTKNLELECQLRKEAEEKASQEAVAKLDAIMALRKEQQKFSEYSFQELQTATNGFHEENKLGEGGYGPVYRGKLYHTNVAIKALAREGAQGYDEFQKEVEFLSRIHHPHMVMLLGACPEKGCLVYEYMENGSLEDRLNCKDGTPSLPWYVRFRICLEVATALLFLHSRPEPIIHRDLKPGNILLNHYFVSKIGDVGLAKLIPTNVSINASKYKESKYKESMLVGTFAYIDPDYQRTGVVSRESDVYSLGIVMLQLLTGRAAVGVADLVEEAVDNGQLESVLDKSAGDWPLPEAMVLACLSMQCAEPRRRHRPNLETKILPDLERIQNVAGIAAANRACIAPPMFGSKPIPPSFFFCPLSQDVMENPHMAADGFTYELDTIKVWLQGHDTSPMTNLPLNHKTLIPNHTLRSTIKDWYDNGLLSY